MKEGLKRIKKKILNKYKEKNRLGLLCLRVSALRVSACIYKEAKEKNRLALTNTKTK